MDDNQLYLAFEMNCGTDYNSVAYSLDTKGLNANYAYVYNNKGRFAIQIIYSHGTQLVQTASGSTAGAGIVMAIKISQ